MIPRSTSRGLLVLVGLGLWSPITFAFGHVGNAPTAQSKYLPSQAGEISVNVSQKSFDQVSKICGLSPAEAGDFGRARQRLVDVIGLQPAAKPPRGVSLSWFIQATPPPAAGKAGTPSRPAEMTCALHFNSILEKNGKPVWDSDSPVEMMVFLNAPEEAGYESFANGELRDSMNRKIYFQLVRVGEAQGHPIYRDSHGLEIVILSRAQRPVWIPLTQEEFLKLSIRSTESQLNELGDAAKDAASPLVARLARHKAVLAAMAPAQRAAQAMYLRNDDPREPDLAPQKSEKTRPLVVINPEWFDPVLPRSAIQLVSVIFDYGPSFDPDDPKPGDDGEVEGLRLLEMRRTIDWNAVSSLLAK